jgi:hypothetical protein
MKPEDEGYLRAHSFFQSDGLIPILLLFQFVQSFTEKEKPPAMSGLRQLAPHVAESYILVFSTNEQLLSSTVTTMPRSPDRAGAEDERFSRELR